MQNKKNKEKANLSFLLIIVFFIAFSVNPVLGIVLIFIIASYFKNKTTTIKPSASNIAEFIMSMQSNLQNNLVKNNLALTSAEISNSEEISLDNKILLSPIRASRLLSTPNRLQKRKKYLHIALNSTLDEAREIISQLPPSDRVLIEAGTPLIKIYGTEAISRIKSMAPFGTYIVADNKCADLGAREVEIMAKAGANASTCLGVAPIETIDSFIEECQKYNLDSIVDMMNVDNALLVLKKLKKLPDVVMLHRGVDESEFSKEKQIPYYQIKQIKGSYNVLVAVAGGDTIQEAQRAIFNDADIVVVWKNFYQASGETAQLAKDFLKEIK